MGHYDRFEHEENLQHIANMATEKREANERLRAKHVAEGFLEENGIEAYEFKISNKMCKQIKESLDDTMGFTNGPVSGVCAPSAWDNEKFTPADKTTFASGAQKDQTGKPRFDLIPPEAMQALADTYALGAVKYNDRNWEKGIPFSAALGALKRHLNAFEMGDMINTADGDIEHIAHVMWWAVALTTFVKRGRLDLNDLPHYNELI